MTFRVMHILDHSVPLHSGYSFRTLAILREQRILGWETFQLTSSKHYGSTALEEEIDGFRFHRTPVSAGGWREWPVASQVAVIVDTQKRLAALVDRTRPEILHAHSPCLNGIAALNVGRRFGIPVVYELRASWEDAAVDHGTTSEGSVRYRLSRALESWTLRRADAITTICNGLRDDILSRGIAAADVTVIPNAVDPSAFAVIDTPDIALRRQLGLDGAFTLGFIGSFYGYEGLSTLLDALPLILSNEPTARVLLVGGGPEEDRLKSQTKRLGIESRVIFVGRVPHDQVVKYYSVIDLLVYPRNSVRLTETVTPLKPLEAMAQGRLMIASNVGGHRELINDGRTGYLFPPGQPAALADAVGRVRSQTVGNQAVRSAARAMVDKERNWKSSVARYREVYERARERHRRG